MNPFIFPILPFVAAAGLGFVGALRRMKPVNSNSGSPNLNQQPTSAVRGSSQNRLRASSMLQPA